MIRNFKAFHKKGWYDNEDRFLDAVYRRNRQKIDKAYSEKKKLLGDNGKSFGSFKTHFKKQVKLTQEANQVSLTKAIKLYANYPMFKSKREVGIDNLLSGLKKNPEAWEYFRNLNRGEKGQFLSFDPDKLTWVNGKLAIYDNRIEISFQDSPVGVMVYDLRGGSAQTFEYGLE